MQDATAAVPRNCCPFDGRCRPPRGWAGSSLHQPTGAFYFVKSGYLDRFQRAGNRLQMAARQVQADRRVFELGASEKDLDGAQIGAGFQYVRCETVAPISLCANMSETSSPSTITLGRGKKSHFDKHGQDKYFFRCVGSFGA